MNPDLEKRVPREILEELIEEGTEAFRGILEKLFNVAMQLERSEFLGAEAYERTENRRGYRNGFKGKRIQTRVGELRLEIPQVRGLSFYPKSLDRKPSPLPTSIPATPRIRNSARGEPRMGRFGMRFARRVARSG